jgi:hypothetical protein
MTDVFLGGIGSYSLYMMIAASFVFAPGNMSHAGLAKQLLHVLRFWAEFDTTNKGISLLHDKQRKERIFEKGTVLVMSETTKVKLKVCQTSCSKRSGRLIVAGIGTRGSRQNTRHPSPFAMPSRSRR